MKTSVRAFLCQIEWVFCITTAVAMVAADWSSAVAMVAADWSTHQWEDKRDRHRPQVVHLVLVLELCLQLVQQRRALAQRQRVTCPRRTARLAPVDDVEHLL